MQGPFSGLRCTNTSASQSRNHSSNAVLLTIAMRGIARSMCSIVYTNETSPTVSQEIAGSQLGGIDLEMEMEVGSCDIACHGK